MKKNECFHLTITDLDQDGNGIGHLQDNGMAVFVKDTVPGDDIIVRIVKLKKNLAYGRLEEVITPSPLRVTPQCAKARACGGCTLQQMDYSAQLAVKQKKVKNCLLRIGGLSVTEDEEESAQSGMAYMEPITGMEEPWHFRNKMQFPVGTDAAGQAVLGFYAGHTHSLIPLEDCPIGHPVNAVIIKVVKTWIRDFSIPVYDETTHTGLLRHVLTRVGFSSRQLMVCLVANGRNIDYAEELANRLIKALSEAGSDLVLTSLMLNINTEKTNRILGTRSKVLYGSPYITDSIGDLQFRISPQSFYQVNPVQTRRIYEKACEFADLTGEETVWDMYCGTGTISLFLSQKARQVLGVEIIPEAIRDAEENARINQIQNASFFVGKAEEVVPEWVKEHGKDVRIDVVVVDPPRKGCDIRLLETIVKMNPKRLVYVSCDPATLARDLKYLTAEGFVLKKVAAFDAFCHSMHVESVVLITRAGVETTDQMF